MAAQKGSARHRVSSPKRGDIYLVNFDPTIGHEIRKTRPALVIQNDVGNQHSPVTIVAAMTSKVDDPTYPTDVTVRAGESGLAQDSTVVLNQIRTIDKRRLAKHLGRVSPRTMQSIDRAIMISLGLHNFDV